MALEMYTRSLSTLPGVTVLMLRGTVDSDTAPFFEKELEKLLSEGKTKILADLGQVEYISSAGVGIFIGMIHRFREEDGGDIKACRASDKIMKVFDAIGLSDMMDFYPDEAALNTWGQIEQVKEELDHFQVSTPASEIYCGEEFPLQVAALDSGQKPFQDFKGKLTLAASAGLVFPNEISGFQEGIWNGPAAVTGSGALTLTVSDGQMSAALEIQVKERPDKAQFPLTIPCRTCQAEVTVQTPDIYRCEECDETFFVDAWGHVFTLKPGSTAKRRKSKYKGMELKINTDVNYLSAIRDMISGLCAKEGMDPVTTNSVALAIEEILLNLIEHGNDFDPWQILKVRMDFQKRQVKIQIRDYGDPYDVTQNKELSIKSSMVKGLKRGVGTFLVNQLMDQVKYETNKNYNQLTMIKHYGEKEEK